MARCGCGARLCCCCCGERESRTPEELVRPSPRAPPAAPDPPFLRTRVCRRSPLTPALGPAPLGSGERCCGVGPSASGPAVGTSGCSSWPSLSSDARSRPVCCWAWCFTASAVPIPARILCLGLVFQPVKPLPLAALTWSDAGRGSL